MRRACRLCETPKSPRGPRARQEWALQRRGRNSFLLSLELASMGCEQLSFLCGSVVRKKLPPSADKARLLAQLLCWVFRPTVSGQSRSTQVMVDSEIRPCSVSAGCENTALLLAGLCGLGFPCPLACQELPFAWQSRRAEAPTLLLLSCCRLQLLHLGVSERKIDPKSGRPALLT